MSKNYTIEEIYNIFKIYTFTKVDFISKHTLWHSSPENFLIIFILLCAIVLIKKGFELLKLEFNWYRNQ